MNNVQILIDDLMTMYGNNTALALFMHRNLSIHQQKSLYSRRFLTVAGRVISCGSTAFLSSATLSRFLRTSLKGTLRRRLTYIFSRSIKSLIYNIFTYKVWSLNFYRKGSEI